LLCFAVRCAALPPLPHRPAGFPLFFAEQRVADLRRLHQLCKPVAGAEDELRARFRDAVLAAGREILADSARAGSAVPFTEDVVALHKRVLAMVEHAFDGPTVRDFEAVAHSAFLDITTQNKRTAEFLAGCVPSLPFPQCVVSCRVVSCRAVPCRVVSYRVSRLLSSALWSCSVCGRKAVPSCVWYIVGSPPLDTWTTR
jgi:hypothetical protein